MLNNHLPILLVGTFQLVLDGSNNISTNDYAGCKLGSILAKEKCDSYVVCSKG